MLVETRPMFGTELTSALDKASDQVASALQGASLVIQAVADSMVTTVSDMLTSVRES